MRTFNRYDEKRQPAGYGLLALMLLLIIVITFSKDGLQESKMAGAALVGSGEASSKEASEAETEASEEEVAKAAEEVAAAANELAAGYVMPREVPTVAAEQIDSETLWLARVIYSETKKPREQELVAWVVRNRVETSYRGNNSYREAVLDPYQFSAFNPGSPKRSYYMGLNAYSKAPGWQRALSIAKQVREASVSVRPFPRDTRHFYSERSMVGRRHPSWSRGGDQVRPNRPYEIEERRFRFIKDVS